MSVYHQLKGPWSTHRAAHTTKRVSSKVHDIFRRAYHFQIYLHEHADKNGNGQLQVGHGKADKKSDNEEGPDVRMLFRSRPWQTPIVGAKVKQT